MTEWVAMDGYGAYIWPSYGLATLLMIVLYITSRRLLHRQQRALEKLGFSRRSDDDGYSITEGEP